MTMPAAAIRPASVEELQNAISEHPRVLPRGGGTKPALTVPSDGAVLLDLSGLAGVLEYEPSEFTFTALAGTRLRDVRALLAQHGQYLPFDPPLVEAGATLGGTLAAGLSGPGRMRYGGVRDFILGVQMATGQAELVRAGGKVVKNAAGFDIPKLVVGSLGQFGALVEVTFKVFPESPAYLTLRRLYSTMAEALAGLRAIGAARLDVAALDLMVEADGVRMEIRLGGLAGALPARAARLSSVLGGADMIESDAALWRETADFAWRPEPWSLTKVPITPGRVAALDDALSRLPSRRRYTAAGACAWIALPDPPAKLHDLLTALGLSGLVLFGPAGPVRLGARGGEAMERRVKDVFDPAGRFPAY